MDTYQKINSLWTRDKRGMIQPGSYACPEFRYLRDSKWLFTEKVHGTNIRVGISKRGTGMIDVTFGGRTDNAQLHAKLVKRLAELFKSDEGLRRIVEAFTYDGDICLYGEGYGAGVQKGGGNYKADGQDFVLFDVKVGDFWLGFNNVVDVADKLGIETVPIVSLGSLAKMERIVKNGFDSAWGPFPAEGLVGKPEVQLFNRKGERIVVKLKSEDYLRLEAEKRKSRPLTAEG